MSFEPLKQRCPILSPFATCGGFYVNVVTRSLSIRYLIMNESVKLLFCPRGDTKDFVAIQEWPMQQWSSGRALGSWSEGCGFDPCPMLDGSGVKAMLGSIPTLNSGSL